MKRSEAYKTIKEWEEIFSSHYEEWNAHAIESPEKMDFFKMEAEDIGHILRHTSEIADFITDNNDIPLFEDYSNCHVWVNQMMDIWEKRIFLFGSQNDYYFAEMSQYFDRAEKVFYPLYEIKRLIYPEHGNTEKTIIPTEKSPANNEKKEILKGCFISSFLGIGNGNVNHFDQLIEEISKPRSGIELAKALWFIYNSKEVNRHKRPKSYSQWLSLWCDYLDRKFTYYKPSKLDTSGLETVFYYITPH